MDSNVFTKLLLFIIRIYQKILSPYLGGNCRFYPSCSDYAAQAIHKYGPWRGSVRGAWRLLRCNPFSKGGIDYP